MRFTNDIFIIILAIVLFTGCATIKSNKGKGNTVADLRAEVFTASAYCSCVKCCKKPPSDKRYGITATGRVAQWGTVAVDRDVIELGSRLRIEGFPDTTFRAEDVGGGVKGNHIDIWFPSHKEALSFGVKEMVVYRY
ncbi:MAG: 3D domain-containing protein [Candidatus Scalindua sp.]